MTKAFPNSDSPQCRQVQDALQRFLDGGECALSPELQAHRSVCPSCLSEYHAAILLRPAVGRLASPSPSPAWTNATVTAVMAASAPRVQQRRLAWRIAAWAAVAAALLLGLANWRPWSESTIVREGTIARAPVDNSASPVYVDKGLSEARSLMAELTRRTADGAVQPTRNLLPTEAPPSPLAVRETLPHAVEPATESLADIRQGAASGLEPVANSARRAFAMFLREVPALPPERKPDS
jgi:hypothetical protein